MDARERGCVVLCIPASSRRSHIFSPPPPPTHSRAPTHSPHSVPFIRNAIPPPMHYPATGVGSAFAWGLIKLFYSTSLWGNAQGVGMLLGNMLKAKPSAAAAAAGAARAPAAASAGGRGAAKVGTVRARSTSRSRKAAAAK